MPKVSTHNLFNDFVNVPEEFESKEKFGQKVIRICKSIPRGRVTTYGTIAVLAGLPRGARLVGGMLHFSNQRDPLPWQRVINRHGFISTKCLDHPKAEQKMLLEQEGIEVTDDFMIDLGRYFWPREGEL